jgi:hypothetical protein
MFNKYKYKKNYLHWEEFGGIVGRLFIIEKLERLESFGRRVGELSNFYLNFNKFFKT